jgi:asparagine synthase (glutamine-hydrolysing)
MCGIFFSIGMKDTVKQYEGFLSMKKRGPDNSTFITCPGNISIGFHRLMINDLSLNGNQPIVYDDVYLICNGEIYNHNDLKLKHSIICTSNSDCEVIVHLYKKLRKVNTSKESVRMLCNELDGEFAFIIYDTNSNEIIVARDPAGVRPLFIGVGREDNHHILCFSSELKGINDLVNPKFGYIDQIIPSKAIHINANDFYKKGFWNSCMFIDYKSASSIENAQACFSLLERDTLRMLIEKSIFKRLESDRPICALLSGGLDSSIVCGVLSKYIKLHTFSIGLEGSTDLVYAKKVADHIGSIHHEVKLSEDDFLNAIEETIRTIESYDITTVRASIGNLLVAKYISATTDFKVVFTGEYSDELFASYLYFSNAPSPHELFKESQRLLKDIRYFDSLRADRCISSCGLEARVPFSDKDLISFVESLNPELRMSDDKIEKYILRKAFEGTNIIPDSILWRKKEAFSDGVSSPHNSLHTLLKKHIDNIISDEEFSLNSSRFEYNLPKTKEAYYYRKIFSQYYDHHHVIPYYWMPKWNGNHRQENCRVTIMFNKLCQI